ncbi:type II toxin-antitoxin system SpoIISB family antitoxin, partial [Bacillus inaquosorum]
MERAFQNGCEPRAAKPFKILKKRS